MKYSENVFCNKWRWFVLEDEVVLQETYRWGIFSKFYEKIITVFSCFKIITKCYLEKKKIIIILKFIIIFSLFFERCVSKAGN